MKFGYDGIVFASDAKGPAFNFEPKEWYLALAAEIPGADGKLAAKPNKTWKQVNPRLPDWQIAAFIPGEKHGTREVFEEKVLHAGCKAAGAIDAMKKARHATRRRPTRPATRCARTARRSTSTATTPRRWPACSPTRQGIGVFGLSFYENNTDKLKVATISGVEPSVETVASGKYPVSRPLFFYVKKAHIGVIPGLKEYVEFFTSRQDDRPRGPLADYGLVPLPDSERKEVQALVKDGKSM